MVPKIHSPYRENINRVGGALLDLLLAGAVGTDKNCDNGEVGRQTGDTPMRATAMN